MNPITTFTVLSHPPPLFLRSFRSEGKNARSVKGRANASENANIVTIGIHHAPLLDVAWIRTLPTIGPVHENDTSTSVRAMKNTPASPFLSEPLSLLLTRDCGRVISNAPKNEAANTMKMMKKRMFGSQCVAIQLKMSAVTDSPPMILVITIRSAIGRV